MEKEQAKTWYQKVDWKKPRIYLIFSSVLVILVVLVFLIIYSNLEFFHSKSILGKFTKP